MPSRTARVELWTDGSGMSFGPIGWAYVLRAISSEGEILKEVEASGGEHDGTNNRAEMLGIIHGLEAITRPTGVIVISDSQYALSGLAGGWVDRWAANDWLSAQGDPVKNVDLWQRMQAAAAPHVVIWRHVKGHQHHYVCGGCAREHAKRPPGNNCLACGAKTLRVPIWPLNERCDELAGAARREYEPMELIA